MKIEEAATKTASCMTGLTYKQNRKVGFFPYKREERLLTWSVFMTVKGIEMSSKANNLYEICACINI